MTFEFGAFELDLGQVELRRDGRVVALEPKAFDLLAMLVENRDRVVSRDEVFDQIWPDVFVTEASLSTAIAQIRRALGDDGTTQTYVKTVRGRGFRFVAEAKVRATPPALPGIGPTTTAHQPQTPAHSGPPVIAVLPFGLIGTEDAHRAIAEAVPSELIATLTQLKWLKVIARGSAFRFRGPDVSLEDLRDQLGAAYVLSGTIELAGSRLSIMAELVDARSQQIVWCEAFSGPLEDVFELRARIAREIAGALEYRLALHEAEMLLRVPSENLDAWGHYHLGVRAMYHYNKADNQAAGSHFARAVELDPGFARAHAALSYTEFQNYFQQFGQEFNHHRQTARDYAETAVRLDPFDPYANLMMGRAHWISDELEDGLNWVERSLDLAPNYSFAFYNSGLLNTVLCDGERAETHVAAALARSPLDPHMQTMLGTRALAAFVRDDAELALSHAQNAMRRPNAHPHVYIIAAGILATYGESSKATRALDGLRAWNVTYRTSGFEKHFDLRDAERKQALVSALELLGI